MEAGRLGELIALVKNNFTFDNDKRSIANFGWICKGDKVKRHGSSACHAMVSYPATDNYIAIISQVMHSNYRDGLDERTQREYYNWLLNESPMAPTFLTHDVDQVFNDGFVLLDADQPRNVIAAACIMHRYIWEEVKVPRVWMDLVDKGLDKDGAFVLAHSIYVGYENYDRLKDRQVSITTNSNNTNHSIFNGQWYRGLLTNFVNHKLVNVSPEPYCKAMANPERNQYSSGDSCNIGDIFCNKRGLYQGKALDMVGVFRGLVYGLINGVDTDSTNPFNKVRQHGAVKYVDLLDAVVKIYPQLLKEDSA